jgi:hypothetical protein
MANELINALAHTQVAIAAAFAIAVAHYLLAEVEDGY